MTLAGRAAIVTGASQGLGRAIASSFLEAGASVLLVARTAERLRQTHAELAATISGSRNQEVAMLCGDVSDAAFCDQAVARARALPGELLILVNNAGIYGPIGRLEDVDWQRWVEAIHVNLFGTVLMCRAMVPVLRARGYGKIINLSGGGATAPLPRFSAYAAAKAAVVRVTETLAAELREVHVDVNAVAPGALNTRLLNEVLAAGPDNAGAEFYAKAVQQRDAGGVPLDRGAALTVFLASSESDGVTGRLLSAIWDDWAGLSDKRAELDATDIFTLRRIVPADRGFRW